MLIPQFWAEARVQADAQPRPITIRRFGWSENSQSEAEANAQSRAQSALTQILAGQRLPRRELKRPYNGSEGVPIREEIIERHGDAVITRNSYGARCLNTPDVLFADIDIATGPPAWLLSLSFLPSVVLAAVFVALGQWLIAAILAFVALLPAWTLANLIDRWRVQRSGGHEAIARHRIEYFLNQHPHWHLRLYQTPAGFRVLAVHATFDPTDMAVADLFGTLGVDPIYARMCFRQRCFRARVSPKPWRIGVSDHIQPRSVWPIDPQKLPARQEWLHNYEQIAQNFASCRFLAAMGSNQVHPTAADIQRHHDELSRALQTLPLA